MAFGCIVDFAIGKSGLVHVSELDTSRTADATATWKVGDKMDVKILEYEKASGRCKLSRYVWFQSLNCSVPIRASQKLVRRLRSSLMAGSLWQHNRHRLEAAAIVAAAL